VTVDTTINATFHLPELREQYERHKAAFDLARERLRDEAPKSPDHTQRAAAEAAFKAAMADLDADIDLLWRAAAEGEIPTD
jgi:hypothetical protein